MPLPRRTFITRSAAATAALAFASRTRADSTAAPASRRDFHELRCYRLKADTRLKADAALAPLDAFLEHALLPALDKLGLRHIGVFTEVDVQRESASTAPKPGSPVWVLITHGSIESFVTTAATLPALPAPSDTGGEYVHAAKERPAFERVDTWLYLAFKGLPHLQVPGFSRQRVPTRVFEMRDYESHSEVKAQNKMAMFDDGEIELMKDLGMNPVFFGQGIAGPDLPHLRYITCAADLATHLGNWKRFGPDPRWIAMRDDPRYANNVSRNTARFLVPRPYSAI